MSPTELTGLECHHSEPACAGRRSDRRFRPGRKESLFDFHFQLERADFELGTQLGVAVVRHQTPVTSH